VGRVLMERIAAVLALWVLVGVAFLLYGGYCAHLARHGFGRHE
jgi:hypothetical protein